MKEYKGYWDRPPLNDIAPAAHLIVGRQGCSMYASDRSEHCFCADGGVGMSSKIEFYVPDDDILRELGRLQVRHSHLDHTLRLAIKRMLGISIDDLGYWNETRGMANVLRNRARKLIAERYSDDDNIAGTLNQVLDDAEVATTQRNRLLHSVWMKAPGGEPVLHDRDNTLKMHVGFKLPSVGEVASVSERVERIQRILNHLTRKQ